MNYIEHFQQLKKSDLLGASINGNQVLIKIYGEKTEEYQVSEENRSLVVDKGNIEDLIKKLEIRRRASFVL